MKVVLQGCRHEVTWLCNCRNLLCTRENCMYAHWSLEFGAFMEQDCNGCFHERTLRVKIGNAHSARWHHVNCLPQHRWRGIDPARMHGFHHLTPVDQASHIRICAGLLAQLFSQHRMPAFTSILGCVGASLHVLNSGSLDS